MPELNLPPFNCKIKVKNEKRFIFDSLRKKYVVLTPEEWVRQHFIAFLIAERGYPAGLMGVEISILINQRKRRCDTVVYDETGEPLVIVEYKAPHIEITQEVFDQITRYNISLQVRYLIVSNGINHYCCRINYDSNSYTFLEEIPAYNSL